MKTLFLVIVRHTINDSLETDILGVFSNWVVAKGYARLYLREKYNMFEEDNYFWRREGEMWSTDAMDGHLGTQCAVLPYQIDTLYGLGEPL